MARLGSVDCALEVAKAAGLPVTGIPDDLPPEVRAELDSVLRARATADWTEQEVRAAVSLAWDQVTELQARRDGDDALVERCLRRILAVKRHLRIGPPAVTSGGEKAQAQSWFAGRARLQYGGAVDDNEEF